MRPNFFLVIISSLLFVTAERAVAQVAPSTPSELNSPSTGSPSAPVAAPPWLGVILAENASEGAIVESVIRKSPAHNADVKAGDRIIEINDEAVNSPSSLQMVVRGQRPGDRVRLRIIRNDETRTVEILLTPSPSVDELLARHHIGYHAPEFQFTSIGDKKSAGSLSSLTGKPTVIEFWATWCTPCRPVSRDLTRIGQRFEGQVQIIGVSSEDESTLERYVKANAPGYAIVHDIDDVAHKGFLVRSYPVAFLLDETHRIVAVFSGSDLGPRLEKALAELLVVQEKESGARSPATSESFD